MKKDLKTKLSLNRETLASLQPDILADVAGGQASGLTSDLTRTTRTTLTTTTTLPPPTTTVTRTVVSRLLNNCR
jgi:hypothetical protein